MLRSQGESFLKDCRNTVYFDFIGAYLDRIFQDEFNSPKVDYEKLAIWMSQGVPIFRTYYYHCLPYQSNPPTDQERERFSKRQSFYNRLSQLPRYEIRLGKLERRGKTEDGTPLFIQKRVDILLGVDLFYWPL
ncbi:hypothetical protein [Thermincola potens]|uniref:hypothetical protein n=1 Tax=Thermincola potens TaxID=863643 RepID=UPI0012FD49D9|nr:hypothetical protein [Thermincola potens]